MARVSIYVSDEQKAEMDKLEDQANWSSVAQTAFAQEIKRLKWPKETNMDVAIERLRKSKQDYDQDKKQRGLEIGRNWAMTHASYENLKSVARFKVDKFDEIEKGGLWRWINEALGVNPDPDDHGWFYDEERNEPEPDEYIKAFIEGAQQVWNQVSDKL